MSLRIKTEIDTQEYADKYYYNKKTYGAAYDSFNNVNADDNGDYSK